MRRIFLATLAAAALCVFDLPAGAQSDQQPSREERARHWAADREVMVHARLAGMKAGLGLTADQEKLWNPFESAVQDLLKTRTETVQEAMKMGEGGERVSPVDRLDFMADRMAQRAARLKAVSEAAKPLYGSLDETQKRNFELLGRSMAEDSEPPGPEGYYTARGFSWEPHGWWGMMQ